MRDLFGHDKVEETIERIKTFEPPEGYYLAFSGGKDSITLKELSKMAQVKFDIHYNVTTIDPPELIYFIRKFHSDVIWDRPKIPLLKMLVKRGFHLRTTRWCCSEFKERGGSGRRVLTGIRADESNKRSGRKMVEQCFKDSSKTYINPILDWTENNVWDFIKSHNLPYCSLYDEGFKRIGCIMCPMNYNRIKESERWPGMKKAFQKAFNQLYEVGKERPSFARWSSGKEMFDWWLHDRRKADNPDQTVMFE